MDTDTPKNLEKIVMGIVIVVLIALLTVIGVLSFKRRGLPRIDPNVYQVVVLKEGLQFFSHLKNIDTRSPYLTEVYYLRKEEKTPDSGQSISLIKRGTGEEIYNPEDLLYFNWDNVLFWENLQPKSKVMDAIQQLKNKQTVPMEGPAGGPPLPVSKEPKTQPGTQPPALPK